MVGTSAIAKWDRTPPFTKHSSSQPLLLHAAAAYPPETIANSFQLKHNLNSYTETPRSEIENQQPFQQPFRQPFVDLANMVKLTSARQARMYGPPGTRDLFENLNAFLYLLGTVLLAAGVLLLLPSFGVVNSGLWMILVGVAVVVVVNFHDLHAHLAGIDYNFRFLALDAQLWMVELAAPLVQAIGSILLCIATFLLIRANKGVYDHQEMHLKLVQAFRLVVAGAALWLLGAIHNAFQVYEKTGLRIQVLQKAVSLTCVVASELLLISGVLALQISGRGHKLMRISTWLALMASALLVLAAVLNVVRVVALQQVDRFGAHLESLRGGAEEQLQSSRAHSEPLLSSKGKYQSDIEGDQSNPPYRGSVVPSESFPR